MLLAEEEQGLPIVGHSVTPDRAAALAAGLAHAGTGAGSALLDQPAHLLDPAAALLSAS